MTEEEQIVFNYYKGCNEKDLENFEYLGEISKKHTKYMEILLNLIQKQDIEINKLNNVIDKIIEYTVDTTYRDLGECEFEDRNNVKCIKDCKQCIKRYFIQKVADTNVGDIPEQN